MKRALKWIALVVGLLVLVAAGGLYTILFVGKKPVEDGGQVGVGMVTLKDGIVSVTMIDVGGGKVALVDAGDDKAGKAIDAELGKRGLGRGAVEAILLTHGHPDHTAACKLFPQAAVYAMASERALIGDACKVTRELVDGANIGIGELTVAVFALPGHTAGSVAFLTRGVLFLGDSASAGSDGKVQPAVRLFSKNADQNVASLKALAQRLAPRAAEVKTLAFAHTGPLPGLQPLVDFAASH